MTLSLDVMTTWSRKPRSWCPFYRLCHLSSHLHSCHFVEVDVFADNRRAIDFYKRGGFEAVATVVARAAGDPVGARVRSDGQGQPCRGQASALHQRVGRQRGGQRGFQRARGGRAVQRLGGAGRDALHGAGPAQNS